MIARAFLTPDLNFSVFYDILKKLLISFVHPVVFTCFFFTGLQTGLYFFSLLVYKQGYNFFQIRWVIIFD
jgi:hypothetical protein